MIDTKQLRELMGKATPGTLRGVDGMIVDTREQMLAPFACECYLFTDRKLSRAETKHTRDLIVAAVNSLPEMLDEIERLRKAVANERERCAKIAEDVWDQPECAAHIRMEPTP